MSEDPAYSRAVSLHLFRALDEIGINKLTVKHRRKTFLYQEVACTNSVRLRESNDSKFHFGSQTEGTTTPGLHSDLDMFWCHDFVNVIEDLSAWKQSRLNALMLQENAAPGYCRLQMLRSDVPMARENLPPDEDFTYDDRGRVLLKNTFLTPHVPGFPVTKHGPAGTPKVKPGFRDQDFVSALHCSTWPAQAEEFTRRQRRHGWPTQSLLHKAVQYGIFLVPVGHKLSQTEPLEWRMSASLAERCFMFSLTIVHLKCYVVLKMLVKTFVKPHIKKCISSYHCKTALLYCTENSEPGFWCDDNLLQCVQRCLAMLLTWVIDGFCPHFIMPQDNLFAGKVTARNRDILKSIFTGLVKSYGRALLCVSIDDLGHKLQGKLSTGPSSVLVLDSLATVRLIGDFETYVHSSIQSDIMIILDEKKTTNQITAARSVHQYIRIFTDRIRHADRLERRVIKDYTEALSCWLGSLLASIALSSKARVPKAAIRLMRSKAWYDVASTLKLASVFYCSGELHKVDKILLILEIHFIRNEILQQCGCYEKTVILTDAFCRMMFVTKDRRKRAELFASCVMFSPQEIHCALPAVRYEFFRSNGDDINCRDRVEDMWMDLAAVDCLPYLFYLQFITHRQLGQRDLQELALINLEVCIRNCYNFHHLETSWNLLGQCMEMEQEPEAAMACYRKSLWIRPRNNAAKWHVHLAILCYRMVKNRL